MPTSRVYIDCKSGHGNLPPDDTPWAITSSLSPLSVATNSVEHVPQWLGHLHRQPAYRHSRRTPAPRWIAATQRQALSPCLSHPKQGTEVTGKPHIDSVYYGGNPGIIQHVSSFWRHALVGYHFLEVQCIRHIKFNLRRWFLPLHDSMCNFLLAYPCCLYKAPWKPHIFLRFLWFLASVFSLQGWATM